MSSTDNSMIVLFRYSLSIIPLLPGHHLIISALPWSLHLHFTHSSSGPALWLYVCTLMPSIYPKSQQLNSFSFTDSTITHRSAPFPTQTETSTSLYVVPVAQFMPHYIIINLVTLCHNRSHCTANLSSSQRKGE